MNKTENKRRSKKQSHKILPQDTTAALKELVSLSKQLLEYAEKEMQCLVMGDLLHFAMIQQDKEKLAGRYALASEEFRSRLEDFRGSNQALLTQLDQLQKQLREQTEENNILIDQIRRRATANTRATLFTAQEMGQRVQFLQDNEKAADTQTGA